MTGGSPERPAASGSRGRRRGDPRQGDDLTEVVGDLGGSAVEKIASDVVEKTVSRAFETASDKVGNVAEKGVGLVTPDRHE